MTLSAREKDSAVSPVVGVMLMLVVTIIIAAVVSAFAGGLSSGEESPRQATLRATYSQTTGMVIEHASGDTLEASKLEFVIRPTAQFGSSAENFASTINQKYLNNTAGKPWVSWTTNAQTVTSFNPGDTAYIVPPVHTGQYLQPEVWYRSATAQTWTISHPNNIGRSFYLELYDSSGKMIAKTEVVISP
ncbi:MAG: type IV pilin N-terminal domain-containing protein [Methanoregulaceae archaeon]|jgi:FlaG/FlaF family flagellin (archaellin)|nr:type IV pilin N-terminal domain-containing protein [Methanoregulaceae archaeon]